MKEAHAGARKRWILNQRECGASCARKYAPADRTPRSVRADKGREAICAARFLGQALRAADAGGGENPMRMENA
jgi:hypothetical protein